nr:MAG TPA: hypothetical protein [Caudoviricetes sp.]
MEPIGIEASGSKLVEGPFLKRTPSPLSLASSALIGLSEMEGRATDELEEFP